MNTTFHAKGSRRRYLLIVGLMVLLLILLFGLVDVGAVLTSLRQADWRVLLLATGFLLLAYGLLTVRTRYLLSNWLGFLETLRVDSSGFMLSILLQVPNSVYRAVILGRTTSVTLPQTTSVMVMEVLLAAVLRLLGLGLAITLAAADMSAAGWPLLLGAGVVALILGLLLWVAQRGQQLVPKLAGGLDHLPRVDETRAYRISSTLIAGMATAGSPRRFGTTVLISLAYWSCALAFYYLVLRAFPFEKSISFLNIALVTLVVVPPSTPLVAGLFHGLLVAPLVALNLLDAEKAMAYAVLLHTIQMVCLIVLGVWGLSRMDLDLSELLADMRQHIRGGAVGSERMPSP